MSGSEGRRRHSLAESFRGNAKHSPFAATFLRLQSGTKLPFRGLPAPRQYVEDPRTSSAARSGPTNVHGHLGGLPPRVDLAAEQALGRLMAEASAASLVTAAHDVSDGGLVQTLVEMVLRRGVGATVAVDGDPFVALFSESVARAVVSVPAAGTEALLARAAAYGVPATVVGRTGGDSLAVADAFEIGVDELRTAHEGTLPALFGYVSPARLRPESPTRRCRHGVSRDAGRKRSSVTAEPGGRPGRPVGQAVSPGGSRPCQVEMQTSLPSGSASTQNAGAERR